MINPLVKNRSDVHRTILFSHALGGDAPSVYLAFADYVRPEVPTSASYDIDLYAGEDSQLDGLNQATNATYSRMCLPCLFSNNNYDVWISEERGSSRGSSQVADQLLENQRHYWNFSNDEQALEDLPRIITYILKEAKREKITYVGYSRGTLHMHMLLSAHPEWADKIEAYVGLAPISYLGSIIGPLRLLIPIEPVLRNINEPYASYNILVAINTLLSTVCKAPLLRTTLCRGLFDAIGGPDLGGNILVSSALDIAKLPMLPMLPMLSIVSILSIIRILSNQTIIVID